MECGDADEECEWIACCGMYMCLSCEAAHDRRFPTENPDPVDD
jgi:hypothetical protein